MLKSAEGKILIWLCAILLVLLASVFIAYRATNTLIENERQVSHTQAVLYQINETFSALQDAETGQRGFLLTGAERYLEPYNEAAADISQKLDKLGELTADNPNQLGSLIALRRKADEKFLLMSETIRLRKQNGIEAAQQFVLSDKGKLAMDEIRKIVAAMQSEENRLLELRTAQSEASVRRANLTFLLIALIAAATLGIFYFQIRRSLSERRLLLNAEQIARVNAEFAYQAEQQARSAAETANRLKDEFLATVSHELRTPLNSILGWAQMLRTADFDAANSARALETIERNARSQAQLIEDLLDISRIVSGKLRLDVRPLEVAPVIEAAIEAVRPAAEAKQIALRQVIDERAGTISGDSERLQQVIWNLLTNAIKFSPKNGKVEVRLERVGSFAQITVKDSGEGIEPAFLPHVFELFRQADGQTTRSHGGLGLGLAIVSKIVEMHGGTVLAASEGENKGATFIVQLPLRGVQNFEPLLPDGMARVYPEVNSDRSGFQLENLPSLAGLRILAVDDQPDTLEMIFAVLTRSGAAVKTANSAQAAFSELQAWQPDILVTDIGMPGDDGFSLIGKVRKLSADKGGKTPAIALTAYARVEDRLKTLSAGFQMHVPKPVEPAELIAIVASLVGRVAPNES